MDLPESTEYNVYVYIQPYMYNNCLSNSVYKYHYCLNQIFQGPVDLWYLFLHEHFKSCSNFGITFTKLITGLPSDDDAPVQLELEL